MPIETLRLRHASLVDAKRLYDWSMALNPEASTAWGEPIWEDHLIRVERSLGRTDRLIFIGEAVRTDEAIGAVRFDAIGPGLWTLDIIVEPLFRRRGWSRKLLAAGLDHFDDADFVARLDPGDRRARALFEGMGFIPAPATAAVVPYRLSRRRPD